MNGRWGDPEAIRQGFQDYASRATKAWQEMAERGRQLAIEQGIDPDELRPTDPDEVGPEFLREHSPSLLVLGNEVILTWTWAQDTDDQLTIEDHIEWYEPPEDWYDCPEDED